ncbi:MAG: hypothetical protein KF876_16310 [Nitrospira sp.]|nr:hypothetical protein [Nitrospira sp.]
MERNIWLSLSSALLILSVVGCTHSELDYVRGLCHTNSMVGELQGSKAVLEAKREDLEGAKVSLEVERYEKLSQQLEDYQADWESLNRDTQLACKDWAICQYRSRQDGGNQNCAESRRAMEDRQKQARGFFERVRALKAEKNLTEIKERIQPRRISDEQRAHLLEILTRSAKGPVRINVSLVDQEAHFYGGQLKEILKTSGWQDVHLSYSIRTGVPVGLFLLIQDWDRPPAFAADLRKALDANGILFMAKSDSKIPGDMLGVLVGMKP